MSPRVISFQELFSSFRVIRPEFKFAFLMADNFFMRISSGISEIALTAMKGNNISTERIYVWPRYNSGRVEKIRPLIRQTDTSIIYSKPSPEDREKILSYYHDNPVREYNASGSYQFQSKLVKPGSLFDATV